MSQILRLGVVGALLWFSACQVSADLTLTVDEGGSGTVAVSVGLDDEALERLGDPENPFAVDDLAAAGWAVSPVMRDDDGLNQVVVTKSFGSLGEGEAVLAEVVGDTGVFDAVSLTRTDSFTTTTYEFDVVVDLSGGLAAFSDPELAEALDGEPVGESIDAIEERFGAPVSELFSFEVSIALPGGETTTVNPALGDEPTTISATGEITDRTPLVWLAIAGASVFAALALLAWRLVRRRASSDEVAAD